MRWTGDDARYGSVAIALHWTAAAAILALLVLGFLAANDIDDARKAVLLRLHVPLGVLALALTLARILWWRFDRRPARPRGQPGWQGTLARTVHTLLLLVVLATAASGIALVALSGVAARLFFGSAAPLPDFSAFAPLAAHKAGAFAIIGLLVLHVGAALYHQAWRGDRLLARMGVGSPSA